MPLISIVLTLMGAVPVSVTKLLLTAKLFPLLS